MTDQKTVLLLPGPASTEAAPHYFGEGYDYVSYLTDNYLSDNCAYITNGKLKPFAGRNVLLWQAPPRGAAESLKEGPTSVIRELLKLKCTVHIIALNDDDEQYEPMVCRRLEMPADELITWAKAHKRAVELPPEEPPVPRETKPAKRGTPRSKPDRSPPAGVEIDGKTGSVFVSWERLGLECSSNGSPHPHLANVQRILAYHPDLVGRIWFDEFHGEIRQTLFTPEPTAWTDSFDTRLTIWIQSNLRIAKIGHQTVQRAVDDYARQNVRNEVREWMDGLQWDGRERLPGLMTKAFGADLNEYTAAVGRCWMVSMVARTYEPGCKVDTMPVFEGPQGLQKSTALRIIGGKWFTEMHEQITSKDFLQGLPGSLLIEIPELHAFGKADIRTIKGIISNAVDKYRASYGRRAEKHPRRSVFSGTTNRDDWNEDDTGARRLWPIACGIVDLDYLRQRREQLFAEAVHRYKAGESWWDIDPILATQEQEKRRENDVWTNAVLQFCEGKAEVTVGEILGSVIDLPLRDRGKIEQMRIASILRVAGWRKKEVWRDGRMVKAWVILK